MTSYTLKSENESSWNYKICWVISIFVFSKTVVLTIRWSVVTINTIYSKMSINVICSARSLGFSPSVIVLLPNLFLVLQSFKYLSTLEYLLNYFALSGTLF